MGNEIIQRFKELNQAMIDKDRNKLMEIMSEDATLTHMSGKTQTREEYIGEIMDGTLNYFKYELKNPVVEIDCRNNEYDADESIYPSRPFTSQPLYKKTRIVGGKEPFPIQ